MLSALHLFVRYPDVRDKPCAAVKSISGPGQSVPQPTGEQLKRSETLGTKSVPLIP